MTAIHVFRGLLSRILAAALLLSVLISGFPVYARGTTGEPAQTVETAPAAETAAPETEAVEMIPEPADTQPPETLPEETAPAETVPAETIPKQTLPAETEPPETIPPETVPEETVQTQTPALLASTRSSIQYVKACPEGTEGLTIQGTVTYAGSGLLILQDASGGLPVEPIPEAAVGDVLLLTGTAGERFIVTEFEKKGTEELPCTETELDKLEKQHEYTRILVKNALLGEQTLTQNDTTLPLSAQLPEDIAVGDTVDVWGIYTGEALLADALTRVTLPAPQTAPVIVSPENGMLSAGEGITLHSSTEGASIYYAISLEEDVFSDYTLYDGSIVPPEDVQQFYLRAYAVRDGWLDSEVLDMQFSIVRPAFSWNFYFGLLHAHTNTPDGSGTAAEAFAHAAQVENLDFFAVTDYSHTLDNEDRGSILTDGDNISDDWRAGKAAAEAVTTDSFVGIYGYEMAWPEDWRIGHIGTFNTPGWQAGSQDGFLSPEDYYKVLVTAPDSVSQFNHPDMREGNFRDFTGYRAEYDRVIQLVELTTQTGGLSCDNYIRALNKGWHLGPSHSQDNYSGDWGSTSAVRTVVLAQSLTEESIFDAIRNYRVYATEDSDLEILYEMDGQPMGSILPAPGQEITVALYDPTDGGACTAEVVVNGKVREEPYAVSTDGEPVSIPITGDYGYYFLKITQPDGDVAVTAPIWVDSFADVHIQSLSTDAEKPEQGQEVTFTVTISNEELEALQLDSLEIFVGDTLIHTAQTPITVPAADSIAYTFSYTHPDVGTAEFCATARGTIAGKARVLDAQTLTLRYQNAKTDEEPLVLDTIEKARSQKYVGKILQVKGYVTAGTYNPNNTFPDTIYIQDDTGGIAVMPFNDPGVRVGTPLTVKGRLDVREGNYVLDLLDYEINPGSRYNYDPETSYHAAASDYEAHGGGLLQVEGKVVSLTLTADRKGVSRFILKDSRGDMVTVFIEDCILSGADGVNDLASQVKLGRTVRARGILHMRNGAPVIRVRNCDEVVYVPPTPDPTNPKTGDAIRIPAAIMAVSTAGLLLVLTKKKRR